jgi:DNA-binding HxlR family transcriptional regulator
LICPDRRGGAVHQRRTADPTVVRRAPLPSSRTPLIVRDLFLGLDRFDELVADLGISCNRLTVRLAALAEHGIAERMRYSERPPRDRYWLTEAGRELMPILAALTAWGDRWVTPPGGPPVLFRHRACGHTLTPQVACSHCGEPIAAEKLDVLPGPGGRRARGTLLSSQVISGAATTGSVPSVNPPTDHPVRSR